MPSFQIDDTAEIWNRAIRRLKTGRIAWLTTVSKKYIPHPKPIWFLWEKETFIIFSLPDTFKLEHIRFNSKVALNFDSDGLGGDIIVFHCEDQIDEQFPPANETPDYVHKYRSGLERIDFTPAEFSEKYSVPMRVIPTALRGH